MSGVQFPPSPLFVTPSVYYWWGFLYFVAVQYFVYILYSESLDVFYRGQTNNLQARLKRHNSGLERYTSKGLPWTLLWAAEKSNRSEAKSLEQKLKNLDRKRLTEFMLKYKDSVGGPDELLLIKQLSGC